MASTLLQLLGLVQLISLAFCITTAAVKTEELNGDNLEKDLDTQETGWLFQEKARELEYLKNKLLSPFSGFKSPSYSYGGGYSSSVSSRPSYSVGISYPSYSSGWSNPNSYKKSPVNYLNTWFNKGSYFQNKFNYAPDCFYQVPSKPTSTYFPPKPTYSYGTPLHYYYNNKPTVTYGAPSFGFSAQTSFTSGVNKQPHFQPSSVLPASFFSKSSLPSPQTSSPSWSQLLPSYPLNSGTSYPLPSYPTSHPATPSPSTPAPPPPTPLPSSLYSPSHTPSGSLGLPQAYPGSPTWSSAPISYSVSPASAHSFDSSTPAPPSWSGVVPTFPSSPVLTQNPSTPSPPWSSLEGATPSTSVDPQYIVIPASSNSDSSGHDIAVPQEVLIYPSPLKTKTSFTTFGSKSGLSDEQPPVDPGSPYVAPYYPNVFYISNGQYIDKSPSIQTLGSEQPTQSPPSDVSDAVPPEPLSAPAEDNTTSSARSQPIRTEGSIQPVLTNIYTSNTIDQTRIPVLQQPYVLPYGFYYYYAPQVAPSTYSVPYSIGFRGSLGLQGAAYTTSIEPSRAAPHAYYGYGRGSQGVISNQLTPVQKTC